MYIRDFLPELITMGLMRCSKCKKVKEKEHFSRYEFYKRDYPNCRECKKKKRQEKCPPKLRSPVKDYINRLRNTELMVCTSCKNLKNKKYFTENQFYKQDYPICKECISKRRSKKLLINREIV